MKDEPPAPNFIQNPESINDPGVYGWDNLVELATSDSAQSKDERWQGITTTLLGVVEAAESPGERDSLLARAIFASQFSSPGVRKGIVARVYSGGYAEEVARACDNAPSTLNEARGMPHDEDDGSFHIYSYLVNTADAFRLPPYYAEQFLASYGQPQQADHSTKPHTLQKAVAAEIADGQVSHQTAQSAVEASLNEKRVHGPILDLLKVERFGLQLMFIKKQAERLFGTRKEDLTDSPFARTLANNHNWPIVTHEGDPTTNIIDGTTLAFQEDLRDTFFQLSTPIVADFTPDNTSTDAPSEGQRAALRYGDTLTLTHNIHLLSRYIDREAFWERDGVEFGARPKEEIWSNSEDGGAAPKAASDAINAILKGALNLQNTTGVTLSPEQLYQEAQSNRQTLLVIATQNITELNSIAITMVNPATFKQEEDIYHLRLPSATPAKGSLDMYAAATLGCPALRLTHESRKELTEEERMAYGSANYVDHVLAVAFQEAYARDMFDLNNYQLAA